MGENLHDLPLAHYSAQPLTESVRFTPQKPGEDFKPRGLWFSVEDGDGWREWCEAEGFCLSRLSACHIVTLAPGANVLWLKSAADIDHFTKQYNTPGTVLSRYEMRWFDVAQKYHGIIIAPYCRERRLHRDTSWYYSWDCSSGCIWNPAAIAEVRLEKIAA